MLNNMVAFRFVMAGLRISLICSKSNKVLYLWYLSQLDIFRVNALIFFARSGDNNSEGIRTKTLVHRGKKQLTKENLAASEKEVSHS